MRFALLALVLIIGSGLPNTAHAYVGLGPLVPMIGNGLILLFVVGVTALGIFTYPLMILVEKVRKKYNLSRRAPAGKKR